EPCRSVSNAAMLARPFLQPTFQRGQASVKLLFLFVQSLLAVLYSVHTGGKLLKARQITMQRYRGIYFLTAHFISRLFFRVQGFTRHIPPMQSLPLRIGLRVHCPLLPTIDASLYHSSIPQGKPPESAKRGKAP